MIIDTEKCTAREATSLAARKWFEKKSVRIILSVIGFIAMGILLGKLYSPIELFILKTPVLAVMVLSAAGLVSNIGKFTARKFAVSAGVSALILGIVYPIYVFLSNVDFTNMAFSVPQAIGYEVLRQLPCVVIALAISLIPVMVSAIRKRKAKA